MLPSAPRSRLWIAGVGAVLLLALALPLLAGMGAAGSLAARIPDPWVSANAEGAAARPNVVIILTDDQRKGSEAFMEGVQQQLAAQGVAFTDAHAPTSTCCPSRTSLLTGKLSKDTGVWTNWLPYGGFPLFRSSGQESDTLATRLGAVGYRTALVGKYLNGYGSGAARVQLTNDEFYVPPGWDSWHVFASPSADPHPTLAEGYRNYWLMHKVGADPAQVTRYGDKADDYSTAVLGGLADEFIRSTPTDQPLFLLFTPFGPHKPWETTRQYRKAAVPGTALLVPGFGDPSGKPSWVKAQPPVVPEKAERIRARQVRALYSVDDAVTQVMTALSDTQRLRNTLVVFASDNGYTWGEFNILAEKNYPYTTPVPLIMRWDQGGLMGGRADNRLVANIDIAKTVLSAAAADTNGMPDAVNLLDPAASREGLLISAWRNRGDRQTLMPSYCGWRTRQWLFVRYTGGVFEELYDVSTDPHMLINLALAPTAEQGKALGELRQMTREQCTPLPPDFAWDAPGSAP